MKIDIYKPVVLFLLPAVLAGCSGEREPFPQGGKAGLRIENCSSRGGTDGSPALVKDFGMVLLDDTGGGYAGAVNPLHVTYGEGWIFPEVTLTETPCRLFAFSPFAAIPGKELPLSLVPQTDYLASGEIRLDWQNRSADIAMEHLLCLLEFTIEGSSACTLSVEGVPTGGTYDLAGGRGKRNGPLGWEHPPSAAGQGGKQQGHDPFSGEHIRLAAAGRHPGGRKKIRICIVPEQRRGTHSLRCKCPSLAGRRRLYRNHQT